MKAREKKLLVRFSDKNLTRFTELERELQGKEFAVNHQGQELWNSRRFLWKFLIELTEFK